VDATEGYLNQLETWMRERTTLIVDAGASVETAGGDNDRWRAVREEYGIARTPQADRELILKANEQPRGALVAEIQVALEAVAREVLRNLKKLASLDGYDGKIDRLRAQAERNTEEALRNYRQKVFPKRGMFAFAKEAAQKPSPVMPTGPVSDVIVHTCRFCGAPRTSSELKCQFCGEKFG